MSELQQAQTIRTDIMTSISKRDIAGFLKLEAEYFLGHLNSYKLDALRHNLGMFKKYVLLLDDQQTKQTKIILDKKPSSPSRISNVNFFFSHRGQQVLGNRLECIGGNNVALQKIMQKIKAIFLFQAPEFVNGSELRMKIVDFKRIHKSIVEKCRTIVNV